MKKFLLAILLVLIVSTALSATVKLWTAPNAYQEAFWKALLTEWEKEYPEIKIDWKTIPASGSSEEAILTAVAIGQGPDLCTGIFSGFAAQLAEIDQLVPLNSLDGFEALVSARNMKEAIKNWDLNGDYYVMPIYASAPMFWWNKDLLEEAGFDKPPRTYSEVYELAEKICVPNEVYAMHFLYGNSWWHRWFDFITFYYAAGDGAPYIDVEKQKAVFNNDAAVEVVKFGQTLYENNWTSNELTDNALFEGKLAANLMGTWAIKWGKDTFPEVFPDKILMSAPPVPDNYPEDKPVKSFADTKGMIMFKSTQYKEEAWQFIQWVYSKLEHDKMWLEMTGLPPVRDDLMTNQAFKPFLDENPMLVEFVKQIPYSLPPALTSKTTEVQDLMTTELTEPIFLSDKSAEEIVENAVEVINIELF